MSPPPDVSPPSLPPLWLPWLAAGAGSPPRIAKSSSPGLVAAVAAALDGVVPKMSSTDGAEPAPPPATATASLASIGLGFKMSNAPTLVLLYTLGVEFTDPAPADECGDRSRCSKSRLLVSVLSTCSFKSSIPPPRRSSRGVGAPGAGEDERGAAGAPPMPPRRSPPKGSPPAAPLSRSFPLLFFFIAAMPCFAAAGLDPPMPKKSSKPVKLWLPLEAIWATGAFGEVL
mmetsp:Transcript_31023/g.66704  ORF Transcript_31023/g.66704 Transcript_31023/m.66704 type:complete len:229 (+) Transcript_31023:488-1174(+)